MAQDIYASDFGDLGAKNLQSQSMRQQALARALDTAVQSLQAARAHATELQRMQTSKEEFGQEMGLRRDEFASQKANLDRTFKLDQERNQMEQQRIDIARKQADTGITPAKQREHDFQFQQASSDADQGTFDNVDHVQELYPSLTPSEAGVMFTRSQEARRQIVNDHVTAANAANVMNKETQIRQRIYQIDTDELPKAKKNLGFFHRHDDDVDRLNAERSSLVGEQQKLAPIADALQKDKAVNNLVTFDAKSEQYTPAITPPRWMTAPAGSDSSGSTNPWGRKQAAPAQSDNSGGTRTMSELDETGSAGRKPSNAPTRTATAGAQPSGKTVKIRDRLGRTFTGPAEALNDPDIKKSIDSGDYQVVEPPPSFEQNVDDTAGFLLRN